MTDNKKFSESLGKIVLKLRTEKQITQVDLAKALHFTQSYLSRLENGKAEVNIIELKIIAAFFSLDIDELYKMARTTEKELDSSYLAEIKSDPYKLGMYQQDKTVLEYTELVCKTMQEDGISRKELAKRICRSEIYIGKLLDGDTELSLQRMTEIMTAMGYSLKMTAEKI